MWVIGTISKIWDHFKLIKVQKPEYENVIILNCNADNMNNKEDCIKYNDDLFLLKINQI